MPCFYYLDTKNTVFDSATYAKKPYDDLDHDAAPITSFIATEMRVMSGEAYERTKNVNDL